MVFKDLVTGCAATLSIITFVNCSVPTAMLFVFAFKARTRIIVALALRVTV